MPETRELTISATAHAHFATAAAAEGVSVRTYLERLAERIAPEPAGPGARRTVAEAGPDRRLVELGVVDPRRDASGRR
ncbi:hypothetical protein [Streptomyces sp. NPDC085932]|uniref:hypothetical protein n=1 Tax=Streptomyces sp. NPDC085932 TaxID=3365741 RepID=UPI0037D30579